MMKTFKEYVTIREAGFDPDIVKTGNILAAQNPKVVPGMTSIKDVKTILKNPAMEKLAAQGKNPGAVGAYLAGADAAKQAGLNIKN